ncbi:hypothetical protein [Planctomicrobium piriforme]|uniref:Uncharacterized protein n=1 Tax=Planctomicrobium piriforme TaxID=1576369 RepID=A0A1I3P1K5_9PLAN|nr:hypothetical protein [Planctomicrobium piriforme]SFJ15321.1 hypothetical protein SAMN05421753_1168 [Planctomicrobium piriforme]
MPRPDRTLLRAAQQITDRYAAIHRRELVLKPPPDDLMALQRAWHRLQLCRQHNLTIVGQQAAAAYQRLLSRVAIQLNCAAQNTNAIPVDPSPPSFGEISEELISLSDEFPAVRFDLQEQILSVTTDRIELNGTDLGPFEIELDWSSLANSSPYKVVALEPHSAVSNSHVTHPHVQSETLCEGNAEEVLRRRLKEGRLCEFFLVISNVLQTYNSGSPYVDLDDWEGILCEGCGNTVPDEETNRCQDCRISLCQECVYSCGDCGHSLCHDCEVRCTGCEEPHCSRCLEPCEGCQETFCSQCLNTGLCPNCQETQLESDNDEDDLETETSPAKTTPPTPAEEVPEADLKVLSDCLVEAALPA